MNIMTDSSLQRHHRHFSLRSQKPRRRRLRRTPHPRPRSQRRRLHRRGGVGQVRIGYHDTRVWEDHRGE